MAEHGVCIENLFQEKIRLYGELLDLFGQEKKVLFEADTDAIWRFSNQKQVLAGEIEKIRESILKLLDEAEIHHGMTVQSFSVDRIVRQVPENLSKPLSMMCSKLNDLKNAVHQAATLNANLIKEYLTFIHGFIDIIADTRRPKAFYGNRCYGNASGNQSLLLNKEV